MSFEIELHKAIVSKFEEARKKRRNRVRRSTPVRLKVYNEWFVSGPKTTWRSEKLALKALRQSVALYVHQLVQWSLANPANEPYSYAGYTVDWEGRDKAHERILEEILKNTEVVPISQEEYFKLS